MITHSIYDAITKTTIEFYKGEFKNKCEQLGISSTALSHLKGGKQLSVDNRYILSKNKHLIFTLVEFGTENEYECVTNKTIFIHLNTPYNDNDAKYIYALKIRRQNLATINNKVFYVKEFGQPKVPKAPLKGDQSLEILECLKANKAERKIRSNFRGRFAHLFRKQKSIPYRTRKRTFFDLLGCSKSEFISYIESQFYGDITWENYGKFWHIDHILPLCTFDLTDSEQAQQCWHYTNLRPLTAKENLSRPRDGSDIAR